MAYKDFFDFGGGVNRFVLCGETDEFANLNADRMPEFLQSAQNCLKTNAAARAYVVDRVGESGLEKAIALGFGACVKSPSKLYKSEADAKTKQNEIRPPAIIIFKRNAAGQIAGLKMRRFWAVDKGAGVFEFPKIPPLWKIAKGGGVELNKDPRQDARGKNTLLAYCENIFAAPYCFVVEGFFDFLALQTAGFNAVSVDGANYAVLRNFLKKEIAAGKEIATTFIFIADNDSQAAAKGTQAGGYGVANARHDFAFDAEFQKVKVLKHGILKRQPPEFLAEHFHGQPQEFTEWLDANRIKDAADFLQKSLGDLEIRAKFYKFFGELQALATAAEPASLDAKGKDFFCECEKARNAIPPQTDAESDADAFYKNFFRKAAPLQVTNSKNIFVDFQNFVVENRGLGLYPSPWSTLNTMLDGGLKPRELFVLGGVTNIGKTAMALQWADFVAASGKDVFYFSLEIPKEVLFSRTLARLGNAAGFDYPAASYQYGHASEKAFAAAVGAYQKGIGDRLYYVGGRPSGLDTIDILKIIHQHILTTGRHPLVIVDYFQILRPSSEFGAKVEKEKVDAVVFELKQIATDLKVPILAISTLNRDSYNRPLGVSAYKESGSIEYTADDAAVLNTYCAEKHPQAANSTKVDESPEERFKKELKEFKRGNVILKILKNRNSGGKGEVLMVTEPAKETFTEGSFANEIYSNGESIGGASATVLTAMQALRQRDLELRVAGREADLVNKKARINKLQAETQKIKAQTPAEFLKDDAEPLAVVLPALPLPNGDPPWQD